ncbi:MAG: hypothetical protein VR65_23955 [Desulfobulbaceae bacterium BRH_c16a]|nr:MAG: hypothetical protein VR65_23955 [Desulfobulbaceae bacterium BRH_c16a]
MPRSPQSTPYTFREELAHGITHGIGAGLSIIGLVFLLIFAIRNGNAWHIVSASIYGSSLILLYLSSTLYHLLSAPRLKRLFKRLDHLMIYILIAGTYTPLTLVSLRGGWGWTLFGLIWGMALCGLLLELVFKRKIHWISLVLYLGMGWLIVIAAQPLLASVAPGGIVLLVAGGLLYTLGVIFYVWENLSYHHAIWHLFVMAGSTAHFFSILLYVMVSEA